MKKYNIKNFESSENLTSLKVKFLNIMFDIVIDKVVLFL